MTRTRVAVSPTGYPHIGTIYQALFDYAYARKKKGKFVVRIEDTDRERFVEDAQERLFIALDWFGLVEDESTRKGGKYSPYVQSERLPLYQKHAQQLIENGSAYYCFCSKERLDELRLRLQKEKKNVMYDKHCRSLSQSEIEDKLSQKVAHVIRMKIPQDQTILCNDGLRGELSFLSNTIDDQVILKSDGFPTYHLAAVVDDHVMEITDVVRGEEWLPSFPKHVLLYRYFGWEIPLFFHTPTLRNPDKSKLSKRHGHTSVSWYQEEGYLPEAILNFLALMGWTHPEEKEIFSMEEFYSLFELKDIRHVGPIFDLTKLTWMNGEYIRKMDRESLVAKLQKYYTSAEQSIDSISKKTLIEIVAIAQSRIATLKEFYPLISHFLPEAQFHINTPEDKKIAESLKEEFIKISTWNKDTILEVLRTVLKEHSIRMPVLYTIITGKERGLPLPESLEILGKEKTLARLNKALS